MEPLLTNEIVGLWIASFLTVCVFSFLLGDNPFYKFAEHVYVGVSAGYWMCVGYWGTIKPEIVDKLYARDWIALIPLALGVMLLFQLSSKTSWVSRWPLCFLVGMYAGLQIVYTMDAMIIEQVQASIKPLIAYNTTGGFDLWNTVINWILVFGLLTGMIYFYFSVPHKGLVFGTGARVGIWVLMIALGASFGYTVMARISLLIGRMLFFRDDFWPMIQQLWGGA
ncbi:MAG: hypothetical protein WC314_09335 [Vulcanimicrobiota bacterium]